MSESILFDDLSVDKILQDVNLHTFKKTFGLPKNASDLPHAVQNLLEACEIVARNIGEFSVLTKVVQELSQALIFLRSLFSKPGPKRRVDKPLAYMVLLDFSRVTKAEKGDLAPVLVAMYVCSYRPMQLINSLARHFKKDLLPEVSFVNIHRLSNLLFRARLNSQKSLNKLIRDGIQTPHDRLQAHYTRLYDNCDLQKKRLLTTNFQHSKEALIFNCQQLCSSAESGDPQAICDLLSLHINCPPSHVLGLPLWPKPGSFHWLNIGAHAVHTNRALFLPNGSVSDSEDSKNWYLQRPIARALAQPLDRHYKCNPSAQFLGDLFDPDEFSLNRQNPWLTDLRNRLPIEAAHRCKDDVLAAMAFSDPRLLSKGPSYYQIIMQNNAVALFAEIMESFRIPMLSLQVDPGAQFGSMVDVSEEKVARAWGLLAEKVQLQRPQNKPNWVEVQAFHNAYALLVTLSCALMFCFRAAVKYPVSRGAMGPDFLAFCDKSSHEIKEIVQVPFNSLVKAQIQHYLMHLEAMLKHAKRLRRSSALINLISETLDPASESSFLFLLQSDKLIPIGSAHLVGTLKEEGIELPPNFPRHLNQRAMEGLPRVEQNHISRHGSIFQSSNNCGATEFSSRELVQNAVARIDALFDRLNISVVSGLVSGAGQ